MFIMLILLVKGFALVRQTRLVAMDIKGSNYHIHFICRRFDERFASSPGPSRAVPEYAIRGDNFERICILFVDKQRVLPST
jgi:hypothetical protein